MILVAFRHGLRAAEVCDLRWDQVDFDAAALNVRRVKNGTPSTHPLLGDEMRALARSIPAKGGCPGAAWCLARPAGHRPEPSES
jgi:integrase